MSTSDTSPVALDESSQEPVFAQIRDAVKAARGAALAIIDAELNKPGAGQ